jgi:hypothetical protein
MTSDYLEKRRRNRVRKELRLRKPYLMGPQLDQEVDRIMGIADSGRMDWAMAKKTEILDHAEPEDVTEEEIRAIAKEFGVRPYLLYWLFMNKVTKFQASGREKHNYLAVLRECAVPAIKKELTDDEKVTAALLFGQFACVSITRQEAERLLAEGEL